MNTWTSLKFSAAACLVAMGQLHAGNIETAEAEVSLTPSTFFSQLTNHHRAAPVSLYSLDEDIANTQESVATTIHTIPDSFDESVLQRDDYSTEGSDKVAATSVAAIQTPKFSAAAVSAPSQERVLAARPAATAGALFFLMIFKSIIVAALVMGLKKMFETINGSPRFEQTA